MPGGVRPLPIYRAFTTRFWWRMATGQDGPSSNSVDLAHRLPNAELVLYDDAGHGGFDNRREDLRLPMPYPARADKG